MIFITGEHMKLTKKAKRSLRDVCMDVFLKIMNEDYPCTIDRHPDEWDNEEKRMWDTWASATDKLNEEIIKRIESL